MTIRMPEIAVFHKDARARERARPGATARRCALTSERAPTDGPVRRYKASSPSSPVRMRTVFSTGMIQSLPSPILPVRAAVDDGVGDLLGVPVGHEHLEARLRQEVDRVLPAPVHLGVSTLSTVSSRLGDRDAGDVQGMQRLGDPLHHVQV